MKLSIADNQIWWRIIVIAVTALLTYVSSVTGRPWVPWWFIRTAPFIYTAYILVCYFGGNKWKPLQIILPIIGFVISFGYGFYLISIDARWGLMPGALFTLYNGLFFYLIRPVQGPGDIHVTASQDSSALDQSSQD